MSVINQIKRPYVIFFVFFMHRMFKVIVKLFVDYFDY